MQKKTFYSNGKLLLTGEYLVLDGAKALAIPTKFGQNLIINEIEAALLKWSSFDSDGRLWFQNELSFDEIYNKTPSDDAVKNILLEILHEACLQQPNFFKNHGFELETHLTFPKNWGLGTSSTLINNISQWFEIDAFQLLYNSFGGSGYDIACAKSDQPLVFQLQNEVPHYEVVPFYPVFHEQLYFVYLNQKQNSKTAITNYITKRHKTNAVLKQIDTITEQSIKCNSSTEFAKLMQKHEYLLSEVLEMETTQERLFPDFKGIIKSLGAWGGDFVLVISKENPKDYFAERGFTTFFKYQDMAK